MSPGGPERVPAPALVRCARELAGLRARLDRVERDLEALFAATGHQPLPTEIGALQEIDIVVQSLDALAGFLDQLADAEPGDCAALSRAVQSVPLGDLARRLGGIDLSAPVQAGATELF